MMAQVPFAKDRRVIAALLQDLGDRLFVIVDSDLASRPQRAQDANAVRIATGQQGRPGCRTDALGNAKARESSAVVCHLIEIGRAIARRSEAAEISITEIVGVHDHEIRQRRGRRIDPPARAVSRSKTLLARAPRSQETSSS